MKLLDNAFDGGQAAHKPVSDYEKRPAAVSANTLDSPTGLFGTLDLALRLMRSSKINLTTLHILVILHASGNRPMKLYELASKMGITRAAITSAADTLDQMGFTFRAIVPFDRRAIFFNLTPKGIAFVESIEDSLISCIRESFCGSGI